MKCSICKSGTHLTASCASTCMKFLFSSLQCSHSTFEYFRCKVFIFASHSYIYKSESAESTAVQQIFNREIRSIFFLKEERDRESVWALLKVERKSGVRREKRRARKAKGTWAHLHITATHIIHSYHTHKEQTFHFCWRKERYVFIPIQRFLYATGLDLLCFSVQNTLHETTAGSILPAWMGSLENITLTV